VTKLKAFLILIFTSSFLLAACSDLLAGPASSPDNHIEISENGMYVSEQGDTVIPRVVTAQAGWLCVQADLLGQPGRVLGCSAVPAGENLNVPVSLEIPGLTWTLHPALYLDNGTPGAVEVPDPDVPVQTALGRAVTAEGILLADESWITVSDQPLGEGSTVIVQRVYAPVPALLVIHDLRDEHVMGFKALQIGENLAVPVTLEVRGEARDVFAEMHWDIAADGQLSLSDPAAHLTSGEFLMARFAIQ